jgi:PEP-CTERM/exosortase A-associated glycosyltransferase
MRVLHVLDISVPMLAGYTSRSRYIVLNQRSLGFDPLVLTSVRHDNKNGAEMEVIDGMRYYRTLKPQLNGKRIRLPTNDTPVVREALEINHLRRRILAVARVERPRIIHAHSSILCGIPGYLAARQLGIPFVYEIRAFWEDAAVDAGTNRPGSPKYVAIQRAETELAKRSDALIGICKGIKDELIARGIEEHDVFVVPNGVETSRFKPTPRSEAVAERYGLKGKTVVGYIGTFAAFEGVRYLEEALVALIRSGRDDIRGVIAGEGATYDQCRAIAERAGLADKIVHVGKVPHGDVQSLYSVVDILAYPRDSQRITELVTPLKPLEAMAMGKAVIASDVGGLTELVTDEKTGLICRHEDAADLAAKIRRLADDRLLRSKLGENGREYVAQKREWRGIIESHFEVYQRAEENWSKNRLVWKSLAKMIELAPYEKEW